ncbi:MAG TPA: S8 family serine peptidase [Pyrinomonadaceae bacterium]|nr:S8 family serine peptidase [Pyrinomonadaceae bacterium]
MTTVSAYESNENSTISTYFQIDESWKQGTGKGVGVAIIDSGIDSTHADLQGKVKESVEARAENKRVVFERSEAGDSAGHGTACASIISRIAPDVEFYSIKVLGAGGLGDGIAFLAGLEYAIKNRYQIINLSLGTTKPQFFAPLHDLLDRAYQSGCIVVAAANNLPQPSFPSVFSSSLISVSKHEDSDPFNFGFRYGEVIELTAPGVNVRTAWLNNSYKNLTGNSFACPHIVGIIALLLEKYPELTPFQVKSALYAIAQENQERNKAVEATEKNNSSE